VAPDAPRSTAGTWPHLTLDLAAGGGLLFSTAVADSLVPLGDSLYWLDPVTGSAGVVALPGTGRRISGAPTGDLILELERGVGDGFGAPANLWLFRIPAQAVRRSGG
jgi:hypothetical protein